MKTLRYFLVTLLLALALSITAFAGEMTTGVATPQPAPTPTPEGQMLTPDNGEISTPNSEAVADEVLAEAALSLLQGVLSLL